MADPVIAVRNLYFTYEDGIEALHNINLDILPNEVFVLFGLEALPDPSRFAPTSDDEREIRERLLAAGEQRSEA